MQADIQQLILGAQIALLDKYYPSGNLEQHILEGLRRAKNVMIKANIDENLALYDLVSKELLNRILSQPEWSTLGGTDKNFQVTALNKAFGETGSVLYAVPSGKILYLTELGFAIWSTNTADADNYQIGNAYIFNATTAEYLFILGGNGGNGMPFPKPIVIPGGESVNIIVECRANHNCSMIVSSAGYEL